jgi:hypothetical protein
LFVFFVFFFERVFYYYSGISPRLPWPVEAKARERRRPRAAAAAAAP